MLLQIIRTKDQGPTLILLISYVVLRKLYTLRMLEFENKMTLHCQLSNPNKAEQ